MMSEIGVIRLDNGRVIYVEMEQTHVPVSDGNLLPSDLPEGAEPTAAGDKIIDALKALRENIQVMAEMVQESLRAHQPEEWSVEINIGFKGKTSPIPVILSGETQGGIKVTAKWKRPDTNP